MPDKYVINSNVGLFKYSVYILLIIGITYGISATCSGRFFSDLGFVVIFLIFPLVPLVFHMTKPKIVITKESLEYNSYFFLKICSLSALNNKYVFYLANKKKIKPTVNGPLPIQNPYMTILIIGEYKRGERLLTLATDEWNIADLKKLKEILINFGYSAKFHDSFELLLNQDPQKFHLDTQKYRLDSKEYFENVVEWAKGV